MSAVRPIRKARSASATARPPAALSHSACKWTLVRFETSMPSLPRRNVSDLRLRSRSRRPARQDRGPRHGKRIAPRLSSSGASNHTPRKTGADRAGRRAAGRPSRPRSTRSARGAPASGPAREAHSVDSMASVNPARERSSGSLSSRIATCTHERNAETCGRSSARSRTKPESWVSI